MNQCVPPQGKSCYAHPGEPPPPRRVPHKRHLSSPPHSFINIVDEASSRASGYPAFCCGVLKEGEGGKPHFSAKRRGGGYPKRDKKCPYTPKRFAADKCAPPRRGCNRVRPPFLCIAKGRAPQLLPIGTSEAEHLRSRHPRVLIPSPSSPKGVHRR